MSAGNRTLASWALVAAVLLLVVLGTVLAIDLVVSRSSSQAAATLEAGRADAAIETAHDLDGTVAGVAASDAASDTLTRETRDVILSAPGAAAPLGDPLRDVSLQRLCLRASYRGTAQCMRFTPAR